MSTTMNDGAGKVNCFGLIRNLAAHHAAYTHARAPTTTKKSTTFATVRVTIPARCPWNGRASNGTASTLCSTASSLGGTASLPRGGGTALGSPLLILAHPLGSEEHTSELQSRQYLVCR